MVYRGFFGGGFTLFECKGMTFGQDIFFAKG
jgi:hypothetical protein